MIRKITIAANALGIICCIWMYYIYSAIIGVLFTLLFGSDSVSVAIIGGNGTEPAYSIFMPLFFTIICTVVFSMNLFQLIRNEKH